MSSPTSIANIDVSFMVNALANELLSGKIIGIFLFIEFKK